MTWIADNVTEVAIEGQWSNGRAVVNVIMVQREEDTAEASARDVLNNWQDHIVGQILGNNYVLQGARFRDRNESSGVTGEIAPDIAKPVTGVGVSARTSPNVSILVRKLITAHVGQRAGKMFIVGPDEAEIDEDGALGATYLTALNGFVDDFHAGLSGAGGNELVVVHSLEDGVPVPPATFRPVSTVTALSVDPIVATQRRRLR